MRNHYDILEVECSASADDIRKAYRKMALKWHPDKNREDADKAHDEFLLVQQAYEVLSDPVEKRWYDENKDKMVEDNYKDNQVNVVIFTAASCYTGFHDGPMGFYTVYSELFDSLCEEDMQFRTVDDPDAPLFGDSNSDYEYLVQPFYHYWCVYSTRKPYTWDNPCNLKHANNAFERKKMKQLNREHQDKMKDARNKEIRFLVYFVRKRDKRVQAHNERLRERADEIHRLAQEKTQRDRKESRLRMEGYEEVGWMRADEHQLRMIEEDAEREFGEEEEEEKEEDALYCSSCDKAFRSVNAFDNHKRSKKHLATVMSLMKHLKEMGIEDEEDGENGVEDGDGVDGLEDDSGSMKQEFLEAASIHSTAHSRKKKKKKKGKTVFSANLNEGVVAEPPKKCELDDQPTSQCHHQTNPGVERISGGDDDTIPINNIPPIQRPQTSNDVPPTDVTSTTKSQTHIQTTSTTKSQTHIQTTSSLQPAPNFDPTYSIDHTPQNHPPPSTNLSKPIDISPPEQSFDQTTSTKQPSNHNNRSSKASTNTQFSCRICSCSFETRNKLFQHIKHTGHATLVEGVKKKTKKIKK